MVDDSSFKLQLGKDGNCWRSSRRRLLVPSASYHLSLHRAILELLVFCIRL